MNIRDFSDAANRRQFLEKELNISLNAISNFSFSESDVRNRNIENLIGAAQIPLGIAGPLKLRTTNSKLITYHIPLATTEGALVASVSRGCKAINLSGGAKTMMENIGITRSPLFEVKDLNHGSEVKKWINKNLDKLNQVAQTTSSHLKLTKADFSLIGRKLFVRFYFDTQDAMGMNMATIATEQITEFINQNNKTKCISIASNFDIDKKPAWLNFINGRGKRVWAESIIKKEVIKDVLKTDASKIHQLVIDKCLIGSLISGSIGFNAHFANIIAGIFIATGQDPAHIVEGSLGTTSTQLDSGDLYFSVYLPSLVVGIVGGGTHLPAQKEALSIMKVTSSEDFSRVIGAAVLAGELSLIASLAEGSLVCAHKKLGRKLV